jgi:hypothetical protein
MRSSLRRLVALREHPVLISIIMNSQYALARCEGTIASFMHVHVVSLGPGGVVGSTDMGPVLLSFYRYPRAFSRYGCVWSVCYRFGAGEGDLGMAGQA